MKKITTLTQLSLALLATLSAGSVLAQIPLTLDDAQAVANEDAQEQTISVGAYTSVESGRDASQFKTWNGLDKQGTGADVDMHLHGHQDRIFWSVDASGLGTPIPRVNAEYEKAGSYKVHAGYQRLRHLTDDAVEMPVPHSKWTEGANSKPGSWGNTFDYSDPAVSVEQVRDIFTVGGTVELSEHTQASGDYRFDHRHGSNFRYVRSASREVLYEVNDDHHQGEVKLSYNTDKYSGELRYYVSKYTNNTPVTIGWGYSGSDQSAGPSFTILGISSLDPSNTSNQFQFSNWFKLGATTSVNADIGYTINTLDESTFSYDSNLVHELGNDAQVKLPTVDLGLTSTPIDNLNVNVKYSFRKYDYSSVINTTTTVPYHDNSYSENKVTGSAIYNLGKGYSTRVFGSFSHKEYELVVNHNNTYSGGIELRKRMSDTLSGTVGYTYSGRSTDDWLNWGSSLSNTNPTTPKPNADGSPNTSPLYYFTPWSHAAYDEHAVKFTLVTNPTDAFSITSNGSIFTRDYSRSGVAQALLDGMTDLDGAQFGLDFDYAPSSAWNVYAYYDYSRMMSRINGSYKSFNQKLTDTSHTIGLGFAVHPVDAPWKISLDYNFGFDKTNNRQAAWNYNDVYRIHYASLQGSYALTKTWTLNGVAAYGNASSQDQSRLGDYVSGDNYTNIMGSPNYNAAAFYASVTYKLQ